MLREAERQLKSSIMDQDMVVTYLELVKVRWEGIRNPPTTLQKQMDSKPDQSTNPTMRRLFFGKALFFTKRAIPVLFCSTK